MWDIYWFEHFIRWVKHWKAFNRTSSLESQLEQKGVNLKRAPSNMIFLQLVTQQICSRVITDLTMGSSEEDQKEATTSASSPISSTRMKRQSWAQTSNVSLTSNRNNGYKACYFDVSPLSISAPRVAYRKHTCLVSVPTTSPCSRSSTGSTPHWSNVRSQKA